MPRGKYEIRIDMWPTTPPPTEEMWVYISNAVNSTSDPNQGLKKFGTHGNATVFFRYPSELMDFAAACFIVFAIVGVFGNLVSILALSKSKRLRNATTAFIVNLCAADLLFCCFTMPLSALTFLERDWNYGDPLCKIFPLVRYSNGAVSLFSVIAITINRYVLIVHPKVYSALYSAKSVAVMILLMWASSLVLLLFPLLEVWGRFGYDPKVGTCSILQLNGHSPKMSLYIIAFGLPSLVFVVCYSRIFWVVRRASKKVVESSKIQPGIEAFVTFSCKRKGVLWKNYKNFEPNNKEVTPISRQELKVLRVILVIFLTFIFCYFPVTFVKIFRKEDDLPVLNILGYLGVYFSNIINPVIYVVTSDEYRKAYADLFCAAKSPKLATNAVV